MSDERRDRWRTSRVQASMWWCGDNDCDCTQPLIERITPNLDAGYPWINRETLWSGEFLTATYEYSMEQREERHMAPLRAACERYGIPVPDFARPPVVAASDLDSSEG
jgi:hypothetical protein